MKTTLKKLVRLLHLNIYTVLHFRQNSHGSLGLASTLATPSQEVLEMNPPDCTMTELMNLWQGSSHSYIIPLLPTSTGLHIEHAF